MTDNNNQSTETLQSLPSSQMLPYLLHYQSFREVEFGPEGAVPLERTQLYIDKGVNFYPIYGDFSGHQPVIRAVVCAFLISEAEYGRMLNGKSERELDPYDPALKSTEGRAVLWVASCISMQFGGVARVMNMLLDEIENHPMRDDIIKMAVFVTGPKGYSLATAIGMTQRAEKYEGEMPFFEIATDAGFVQHVAARLPQMWNMTVARDFVRNNRRDFQLAVRETIARRAGS